MQDSSTQGQPVYKILKKHLSLNDPVIKSLCFLSLIPCNYLADFPGVKKTQRNLWNMFVLLVAETSKHMT